MKDSFVQKAGKYTEMGRKLRENVAFNQEREQDFCEKKRDK